MLFCTCSLQIASCELHRNEVPNCGCCVNKDGDNIHSGNASFSFNSSDLSSVTSATILLMVIGLCCCCCCCWQCYCYGDGDVIICHNKCVCRHTACAVHHSAAAVGDLTKYRTRFNEVCRPCTSNPPASQTGEWSCVQCVLLALNSARSLQLKSAVLIHRLRQVSAEATSLPPAGKQTSLS